MGISVLDNRFITRTTFATAAAIIGCVITAPAPLLANSSNTKSDSQSVAVNQTRYTASPYLETEAGYDSNPDGLVNGKGTRYIKQATGINVTAKNSNQTYRLTLQGNRYEYLDFVRTLNSRKSRYDYSAALNAIYYLAPGRKLRLGASYIRDFVPLSTADIVKSYVDYTHTGTNYKLRLQGKSKIELNKSDRGNHLNINQRIFDVTRPRAFDYAKNQGQAALLTFTNRRIQPFLIYNYADINYFHQAKTPIYNRIAKEHWAIAGIRLRPIPTFRIDLGARHNLRDMKDNDFSSFKSQYFDMNFTWRPIRPLTITGVIERTIKEPSTSFGLIDDVITFGSTVSYQLDPKLHIYAAGYLNQSKAVGDDIVKQRYTAQMTATLTPTDNVDVFVSATGRRVKELTFNDKYDRFKIGAGVKLRF